MAFYTSYKLATKLSIAFAVMTALTVSMGIMSIINLQNVSDTSDLIEHVVLPSVQSMAKIRYSLASVRRLESQMILAEGEERKSLISRTATSKKEAADAVD